MHRTGRFQFLLLLMATVAAIANQVRAQEVPPGARKPAFLDGVGIDQKLGSQVPLDLTFTDEHGKLVRLGDYFDGKKKPVILCLVYYKCPNTYCSLELNDLSRGMNGLSTLSAGDDYQVVTVSFDPREGPEEALDKKETYLQSYKRAHADQGWHFLTGDQASIAKLADAVGFHFKYDQKFEQYLHPSGVMVLTPTGLVSRYFFQIDYDMKDLRLSLEEASGNRIGSLTDQILLYCFHYDPATGKYSFRIVQAMQLGAVLTMGALGAFWFAMSRREAVPRKTESSSSGS
jgi:protein SCO1/2